MQLILIATRRAIIFIILILTHYYVLCASTGLVGSITWRATRRPLFYWINSIPFRQRFFAAGQGRLRSPPSNVACLVVVKTSKMIKYVKFTYVSIEAKISYLFHESQHRSNLSVNSQLYLPWLALMCNGQCRLQILLFP